MAVESIAVPPDEKRDARAAAVADQVGTWPRYVLKVDVGAFPAGTEFRRAPSSRDPRVRYRVNGVACECPDYQERGAVCYHVRAYRLWEARRSWPATIAPAGPKARPSYAALFPACDATGCDDEPAPRSAYCRRHDLCDAF